MRKFALAFALCITSVTPSRAHAQQSLSTTAALSQLYNHYDPKTETAIWNCTPGQDEPWDCSPGNNSVAIELLLTSQVTENGITKLYVVASARPDKSPGGYECHACAPEIGVAVFALHDKEWKLESANTSTIAAGQMGDPDEASLLKIGREHNGILLSGCYEGQGYTNCSKFLLAPVGKSVNEVWSIDDEQDDYGAYDPTGKDGPNVEWHSSAAIRFEYDTQTDDEYLRTNEHYDYYDIEVISRGRDEEDKDIKLKSENWTDIYRFKNNKYTRISHTDFTEAKKPTPKPTRPIH